MTLACVCAGALGVAEGSGCQKFASYTRTRERTWNDVHMCATQHVDRPQGHCLVSDVEVGQILCSVLDKGHVVLSNQILHRQNTSSTKSESQHEFTVNNAN